MAEDIKLPPDFTKGMSAASIEKSKKGATEVLAACNHFGLTNKNFQAALLGILCVESRIQSIEEMGSDERFAVMYGTKQGNTREEGIKYKGKGYVQLGGKATYIDTQKTIKKYNMGDFDIVKDPKLALTPHADVCLVAFFFAKFGRDKLVNTVQHSPDIFQRLTAKHNPGEAARYPKNYALKRKYYEWFNNGSVPIIDAEYVPKPTNKEPGNPDTQKSHEEILEAPIHKQEALTENREAFFTEIGFRDPFGKYPLREYMNEADTNRLARGVTKKTCVEFKDSTRNVSIPSVNNTEFNQPFAPYCTEYPYNKVMETESGHVVEYDDTPGGERINIFHRAGTFLEIDNNGTQVNHIIGDSYHIVERNGNVYIKGQCNITISSDANLLVEGDANIEVNGNTDMKFHGNATIGVARNLQLNVAENFEVSVGKNFNVEVGNIDDNDPNNKDKVFGGFTFKSKGQLEFETPELMSFKSAKSISFECEKPFTVNTKDNLTLNTNKSLFMESKEDSVLKSNKGLSLSSQKEMNFKSESSLTIGSKSKLSINTSENVHLSATQIHLAADEIPLQAYVKVPALTAKGLGISVKGNKDAAIPKSPTISPIVVKYNPKSTIKIGNEDDIKNTTSETLYFKRGSLTRQTQFPEVRGRSGTNFEPLEPTERRSSQSARYESEEEINTPEAQAWLDKNGGKQTEVITPIHSVDKPTESIDMDNDLSKDTSKIKPQPKDSSIRNLIITSKSYPPTFKLSKHFILANFVEVGKIIPTSVTLPMTLLDGGGNPKIYTIQDIVENLACLAENIAEPIYELMGPICGKMSSQDPAGRWQINSALRFDKNGSDHNKGRAMDIRLAPKGSHEANYNFALKIKQIIPEFNQMLFEYRQNGPIINQGSQNWIHISYTNGNHNSTNHKQIATYVNDAPVNRGSFVLYNYKEGISDTKK